MGQALGAVYLEKKLEVLRTFGLRGAFEIRQFVCEDLQSKDAAQQAAAQNALASAAKAIAIAPEGLLYAFQQIAYDKSTEFLYEAE